MSNVNTIEVVMVGLLVVAPLCALQVIFLIAIARGMWREASKEPTHD